MIPAELCEIPFLRTYDDTDVLGTLACRFVQQEVKADDVIVEQGRGRRVVLIARGKLEKCARASTATRRCSGYGPTGTIFSYPAILASEDFWEFTAKAATSCTVLRLKEDVFERLVAQNDTLGAHLEAYKVLPALPQDRAGQAERALAFGHQGAPVLPGTFVGYELAPREDKLGVA